jgi:hypothetical protein
MDGLLKNGFRPTNIFHNILNSGLDELLKMKWALNQGFGLYINVLDHNRQTPLDRVCFRFRIHGGFGKEIKLLAKHGAKTSAKLAQNVQG